MQLIQKQLSSYNVVIIAIAYILLRDYYIFIKNMEGVWWALSLRSHLLRYG